MADLTRPKPRQTSFPTVGQTIPKPAEAATYWKGMYLDIPTLGGNVGYCDGSNARFAGICQENKVITVAGEDLDVLWGMLFWVKSDLAVKGNVGKGVAASDTDTLLIAEANKTYVGRIAGVKDGEMFIDATATYSAEQ